MTTPNGTAARRTSVVFMQRKPNRINFSLERMYEMIREALPPDIEARQWVSRFESRGIWRRVWNMIEAVFHQSGVNHIAGDVHYIAILLRKRRTVLTILDTVGLRRLTGWRRSVFKFLWYTLPARRAATITTISHFVREELLAVTGCDPAKVEVVYVPIAETFTRHDKVFNRDCPVILQIGTAWNKNLERQAEALVGVPCRVDYIGIISDSHRATLERHGIQYTAVSGLSDAEIVRHYESCDMLLFASTYEGFGMPIIEANRVGRPVVTATEASMPEVAGDAACLVDPYDVAAIRAGVLRVINDEPYRQQLIANGFVNAERFTARAIALQMAAIYRSLA
jgi:glycosyltransferase involved in cell wall biosynthesis